MMFRKLKPSGLWTGLVALLMAAQLALAFHSLEHKFETGLVQGDECALCQVASNMVPTPSVEPLAPPRLHAFVSIDVAIAPLPQASASRAGFRSRAPPESVSL